jgi:hypothetical protein
MTKRYRRQCEAGNCYLCQALRSAGERIGAICNLPDARPGSFDPRPASLGNAESRPPATRAAGHGCGRMSAP